MYIIWLLSVLLMWFCCVCVVCIIGEYHVTVVCIIGVDIFCLCCVHIWH